MNIQLNSSTFSKGSKTKRQKFGVGSLIFLLLFGAIFTAVGLFAINNSKADPNWTLVSGKVVDSVRDTDDDSTTYAAVVEYSVDGREYQVTSNLSSSFMPTIGEEREVSYDPEQPSKAKVVESAGATFWVWIFPIAGVAIMIYAPVAFAKSLKRSSTIKNLMQTGQKLQGVLTDIQSIGSDENKSYKIVVSATDNSGMVQSYVSDSIAGLGGLALADFRSNPIPVNVYIDPTNPKSYYVDVDGLPGITPQRINELIQSATNTAQPQTILNAQQPVQQPTQPVQQPVPPRDDFQSPFSNV